MSDNDIVEKGKTDDAKKAVQILMSEALKATPYYTEEAILASIDGIRASWGNTPMAKGSRRKIKKIIIKNLKEFSRREDFKYFKIVQLPAYERLGEKASSQIDVFFAGRFIGIRVWKTQDAFFVTGSGAFRVDL
jgi:hypothetical protein